MSNIPKKNPDAVNSFGIVLIGLTSAVLLWVSVVALQAYYESTAGTVEEERQATNQGKEVRELKALQAASLNEWKWVDPKKGTVTLAIDHAMALVVRDANANAPSLVPAVGADYQPTVPAQAGRPPDDATVPGAPPVPPPGAGSVPPPGIVTPAAPTPPLAPGGPTHN